MYTAPYNPLTMSAQRVHPETPAHGYLEVIKYQVSKITGETVIELRFNNRFGNPVTDPQKFKTEAEAHQYIQGSKNDWLKFAFENYLMAIQELMEDSNADAQYYKTPAKLDSFEILTRANAYFVEKDFAVVCTYICKIQSHLERILPGMKNKHYASSKERLIEIISFAKLHNKAFTA